jgi:hypothetical protein
MTSLSEYEKFWWISCNPATRSSAWVGKPILFAQSKGGRTMAGTIALLFLMAIFGIILWGLVFLPSAKEKPSARRQETPAAPSGNDVIA